jgi:hypothetical protein
MTMTTDKLFILLLVILLPLTGCLDIADTAEAEESDDETTIVNNYYNNTTTTTTTMPMVHSLHIEAYTNATLEFDGTSTLKLETHYRDISSPNEYDGISSGYTFTMTCDGVMMINKGMMAVGHYLPVLAGQNCTIEITSTIGSFYIFSEASLTAL